MLVSKKSMKITPRYENPFNITQNKKIGCLRTFSRMTSNKTHYIEEYLLMPLRMLTTIYLCIRTRYGVSCRSTHEHTLAVHVKKSIVWLLLFLAAAQADISWSQSKSTTQKSEARSPDFACARLQGNCTENDFEFQVNSPKDSVHPQKARSNLAAAALNCDSGWWPAARQRVAITGILQGFADTRKEFSWWLLGTYLHVPLTAQLQWWLVSGTN